MAAQPEPYAKDFAVPAELRPAAVVLPMRRATDRVTGPADYAGGSRIGPARGLAIGLALGASLWAGIGLIAWRALH